MFFVIVGYKHFCIIVSYCFSTLIYQCWYCYKISSVFLFFLRRKTENNTKNKNRRVVLKGAVFKQIQFFNSDLSMLSTLIYQCWYCYKISSVFLFFLRRKTENNTKNKNRRVVLKGAVFKQIRIFSLITRFTK